jgi:hypothetical protein
VDCGRDVVEVEALELSGGVAGEDVEVVDEYGERAYCLKRESVERRRL